MLQNSIGGGKPKMFHYFRNTVGTFPKVGNEPAPTTPDDQQKLIDEIQDWKTGYYKTLLETRAVSRPGVISLMDEAIHDPRIAVGVCSASTKEAAIQTLAVTLGDDRVKRLDVCILGDDVSTKKPDPLIYDTAARRLNVPADRCVVIEDSLIGLRAAVAAGMKCIITYTGSTSSVDFYGHGAKAKIPDLASANVTLEDIFGPLRTDGLDAELLVDVRDPMETKLSS